MSLPRHKNKRSRQNRLILAAIVATIIIGIIVAGIGWALRPPQPPALPGDAAKKPPKSNQSSIDIQGKSLSYSRPVSIRIPPMNLPATELLHLGKNSNGTVKVPLGTNTNKPAWYKLGPAPGQVGPAVIMGHVVDEDNQPSIFFRLSSLRTGDKVYISRADGKTAIFTITKVKTFAKRQFPSDLVYGFTDHAALRLVTCSGLGKNTQLGEYTRNVIAFGKLAGSRLRR